MIKLPEIFLSIFWVRFRRARIPGPPGCAAHRGLKNFGHQVTRSLHATVPRESRSSASVSFFALAQVCAKAGIDRGLADTAPVRMSRVDEVHSARNSVIDLEADGPSVGERFNAGAADQFWRCDGLATAYEQHAEAGRADTARAAEVPRLVRRMRELTRAPGPRVRPPFGR